MAVRCPMNTLEDVLLEQVFARVQFHERLGTLPCVCKRWAGILGQPSAAWEHADIDLHLLHKNGGYRDESINARVVTAWFSRRANCMRRLSIENSALEPFMRAAAIAAVFGSQCGTLQRLSFRAYDVGVAGEDMAVLAVLSRLTCLQVTANTVLYDDRCAMLLRTIKHLPALVRLNVYFDGDLGNMRRHPDERHGLPRCEELTKLHSRSLTQLRVCMLDGPEEGNVLRLSGLPALRSCTLEGDAQASQLNLRVDSSSFQGARRLQDLRLVFEENLDIQPGSLEQLTALTKLTLSACGLRSVPADAASLSATLRMLDLSCNERLQIDSDAVSAFLRCSQLTRLSLGKEEITKWENDFGALTYPEEEGYSQLRGACRVCLI